MISIIAIDDEYPVLKSISKKIEEVTGAQLLHGFTKVSEALDFLQTVGSVDIIFCDIEMLEISGLEAAPLLNKYCKRLVFLTGYKQYTFDAFRVRAQAYLMKPLTHAMVMAEMEQLLAEQLRLSVPSSSQRFVVKNLVKKEHLFLNFHDIVCVKAKGHLVEIFCKQEESPIVYRDRIDHMEEVLGNVGGYMRVHESYIIALSAIEKITELSVVHLENGVTARISRNRSEALKKLLDTKQINRIFEET